MPLHTFPTIFSLYIIVNIVYFMFLVLLIVKHYCHMQYELKAHSKLDVTPHIITQVAKKAQHFFTDIDIKD